MPIDESYNTVAERIEEFKAAFPDGRLQPVDLDEPFRVVELGNKTFLMYRALAYRTPDDPRPGFGCAWEPFPGPSAFTRDSELQNVETSAWGRAIIAALVASAKKGIATSEDVENRSAPNAERARDPGSGSKIMTSSHALADAAARAGFTLPAGAAEVDKAEMDAARRDVLQAVTGFRSSKELTTAAQVKAALEAFNGLADGTREFGYDEDGVPTIRTLVP